jgi:FAD/FMN-containing dehydrogenase
MANFNELEYNSKTKNLRIGAGCLFDEVYKEISQYKRNIVGGATAAGVGVAGWLLGGGYSLLTNQYGLGIDNLVEVQVVLCNGRSVKASAERNSDLFFAIRVSYQIIRYHHSPHRNRGAGTTSALLLHSLSKPILWGLYTSVFPCFFTTPFMLISCFIKKNSGTC